MTRAKRIVALSIALLGLLTVTCTGYAGRHVVWEQVCLLRLRSENNLTRARAAYQLGKLGSVRSIPLLLEELEKPPERFDSAKLRSADPEAIRKAAEQPVAHLWAAAHALGDIGRPAVPQLIRALKHGDERVQYFAIRALAGAGPDARDAVPSLLERLQHSHETHRYAAAEALGRIGAATGPVIRGLVSTLKDKHMWVRTHSAEALGMLGPAAASAVADLRLTLEDPEEIVRTNAAIALVRIGLRPDASDPLVSVLASACRGSIYAKEAGKALQMLGLRVYWCVGGGSSGRHSDRTAPRLHSAQ